MTNYYSFVCPDCGNHFSNVGGTSDNRRNSDTQLAGCPFCGSLGRGAGTYE